MKIIPSAPSTPPLSPKTEVPLANSVAGSERARASAVKAAQVHTMPSQAAGSDFNASRVATIREDIRAGRYQVNPEKIADGLLASVHDLLDLKQDK